MKNIKSIFANFAALSPDDLQVEINTLHYKGNKNGVMYFTICDPEFLIDYMLNYWGQYKWINNAYYYNDGTIIKFIKSRKQWQFKQYKKVYCIIELL